ncbi:hypothetical protein R1flu_016891 [Riccia fluitans]|uniref:non-specific serine/threonine protein kinase n=1 Tax=Riccia fluitans TaxID=41844 RepID=A0ABD1YNH9_9MARC
MRDTSGVMDIPPPRKGKAMVRQVMKPYLEPLKVVGSGYVDSEEYDFSDVFGPVPAQPALPALSAVVEGEDDGDWPTPVVQTVDNMLMITNRSHSMVGPLVSPAFSLQFPRRTCEDLDDSGMKNSLDPPDALYVKNLDQVASKAGELALSDSGDSGSEKGAEEQDDHSVGDMEPPKLGPQDFELLRVVGRGAFGKVYQVRKKGTDEIFAMKVMKKQVIVEKNHCDYMKAERDILVKVFHPFIVQLQYSFQTKTKLYLLLDFINGGHLFFQLYRHGTFSEQLARILAAEIVCAVSHLHEKGIIHRDLKPENILIDLEGHVKLTDFGLAKEVVDSKKSNSLCGTVEYMAPEIIEGKGHGKAADWWSVGVLLYEMLTGRPPFLSEKGGNRYKLQQKIVKEKIKLPKHLTSEAITLLKGLLTKDPARRLGSGERGADDIKQHKWFKSICWRKCYNRQLKPEFKPTVNGKLCTANFDEMWTGLPLADSPASTPKDLLYLIPTTGRSSRPIE